MRAFFHHLFEEMPLKPATPERSNGHHHNSSPAQDAHQTHAIVKRANSPQPPQRPQLSNRKCACLLDWADGLNPSTVLFFGPGASSNEIASDASRLLLAGLVCDKKLSAKRAAELKMLVEIARACTFGKEAISQKIAKIREKEGKGETLDALLKDAPPVIVRKNGGAFASLADAFEHQMSPDDIHAFITYAEAMRDYVRALRDNADLQITRAKRQLLANEAAEAAKHAATDGSGAAIHRAAKEDAAAQGSAAANHLLATYMAPAK